MRAFLPAALLLVTGCSGDAAPDASSPYPSFAGCTFEAAEPATRIELAAPGAYAPACARVRAGASVLIHANALHPLQGMTHNGTTPNPIAEGEPSTGWLQDQTFTFPSAGAFGFYCNVHGSDTAKSGGMTGVVYVEP